MNITKTLFTLSISCGMMLSAQAQKKNGASPHLIIYKTKKDYHNRVPVTLSADKSSVVNYPDPKDLTAAGKAALPTPLHKGYLLDNRGVGENVAFLKVTYHEYEQLPSVPSPDELYKMISDKDPLLMLCDCGSKYSYKNPVEEINKLIDDNKLTTKCKMMKKKK